MFFKGSRYEKVGDGEITDAKGETIHYKRIRFIPKARAQRSHVVSQGERLDHIAHKHYRNPERFWRICDANGCLWPDDLLEVGRRILIPSSEG